jgi:hypothetical protein
MEFVDPRKTPFVPVRWRGELPHLYKPGCCYFATFGLADAILYRPRGRSRAEPDAFEDPAELLRD